MDEIMSNAKGEIFKKLFAVDCNEHKEAKNGLSYLSWTWAWAAVKSQYPTATYEIVKQDNGLPFVYDPATGYMVFTRVTIEGLTHEMWLPVMDGANQAMKAEPYEYNTRSGKKRVEAATMTDINKAIMRCLTKNLAMFGLGLYIYAGEDLPEEPSFKCANCGHEFKDKAFAEATMAKWKKHICPQCYEKAAKAAKAKKKAQEAGMSEAAEITADQPVEV